MVEVVVEDQGADASEAEEGYFFENICRLLFRAERMKELSCLLRSSRWVIKVLLRKGVWQLVEAVEELREVASQKPEVIESEQLSAIVLVMQAARLSVSSCDESVAGICFQLYSRTMHKRHVKSVESFLLDIERFAPRPWLLPIRPCVAAAGGKLLETFKTPGSDVGKVMFGTSGAVVGLAWKFEWRFEFPGRRGLEIFSRTKHGTFYKTICDPFGSEDEGALNATESETETARTNQAAAEGRHATQRYAWIKTVGKMLSEKMAACSCFRRTPDNDSADNGTDADNADDSSEAYTSDDERSHVTAACISQDSSRAVIGFNNGDLITWCTRKNERVLSFEGYSSEITDVGMSSDGKRVASGSHDETVRVWDAEMGGRIGETMTGHTDWVTSVSMSGDGKRVASGSDDSTVRVWDAETRVQIGETMTGHTDSVTIVWMSTDGQDVWSISIDGTVWLWKVGPCASDMDKRCETIAHGCEGGRWPVKAFDIDKSRAFVEQGDGTKITLAEFGSGLSIVALNVERGTVAVGMRSGMVGIMTVVSLNHQRP